MLKGTITLNDQECEGTYNFGNTEKYMTKGFKNRFGDEAEELIAKSIEKNHGKIPKQCRLSPGPLL